MKLLRTLIGIGFVLAAATFIAVWLAVESRAQAPETSALAGVWVINHDLSDPAPMSGSRQGGGYGGGRHAGGGGFGRGMGREIGRAHV